MMVGDLALGSATCRNVLIFIGVEMAQNVLIFTGSKENMFLDTKGLDFVNLETILYCVQCSFIQNLIKGKCHGIVSKFQKCSLCIIQD